MVKKITVLLFLFIFTILFLRTTFMSGIDADEIEHTHISWLINNGQLPYKDIHQIHMPLLWIMTAPLIKFLPESSHAILFLRGLTILFFFLTVWIGGKILKKILKKILNISNNNYLFYYYIFTIILAISVEFYKFRPDPFMSFFAITGIFILFKHINNKKTAIFISGIFFGIALSFSLKIFPLLFLYPLINYNKIRKEKIREFITLNIFHYLGIIIGLIPSFIWIFHNRIFYNFYHWVIINNFQMKNSIFLSKMHIAEFSLFILIFIFLNIKYNLNDNYYLKIISLSFILSFTIRIIDPNHLIYNWQLMIILFVILSLLLYSVFVKMVVSKYIKFIIPILLISILSISPTMEAISLKTHGWTIPPKGIDILISLKGDNKEKCVGFSPFHPIFCKDATPLYLLWDYFFILKDWISDEGKTVYKKMWPLSIKNIIDKKPKIIVAPRFFKLAYEKKIINQKHFILLYNFTEKYYEKKQIGKIMILIRKDN